MSVSPTIQTYLEKKGVAFDLMLHDRAVTAQRIARVAHIPGAELAKGVLLKSDHGYLVAVVPASHQIDLAELSHRLDERLGLASEDEASRMFPDCDPGAVPALGTAYDMRTIVDKRLDGIEDIYFEAGDHTTLVHVKRDAFARLMDGKTEHAAIARRH